MANSSAFSFVWRVIPITTTKPSKIISQTLTWTYLHSSFIKYTHSHGIHLWCLAFELSSNIHFELLSPPNQALHNFGLLWKFNSFLKDGGFPIIVRRIFCKLEGNYQRIAPIRSLSGSSMGWVEWTITESDCFKGTIFTSIQRDLKSQLDIIRPYFSTVSVYALFLLQV